MTRWRAFGPLAVEAVVDAGRRRIVAVIAVASLLSLMLVDRCTSCGAGAIVINGQPAELPEVAGWSGMVLFVALGLWVLVLAGVLAADHLAETLGDGTAALALSRPVSRASFALARLAGALAVACAAGAALLGGTAWLLHVRSGLALAPVAWGAAACFVGALAVGALAMSASLRLPRMASAMLAVAGVGAVAAANFLSLLGAELGGLFGALDRFGPPLASAMVAGLAPWIEPVAVRGDPVELGLRLAAWAAGAAALLVVGFARTELS